MPTALVSRIDLDLIYPPFLRSVLDVLAELQAGGADFVATFGLRSFSEQATLYFAGRTMPGPVVTNAPPGYSCHNYGLAIDLVRDFDIKRPGLQPVWTTGSYGVLKLIGEKHGLQVGVPGVSGGDPGHVQVPLTKIFGTKEKAVLERLKEIRARGGLPAVWAFLDKATEQKPADQQPNV